MAASPQTFAEFERAGWESDAVVHDYDALVGPVTRQSIEALLDAAGVQAGSNVVDVATGAGYVAAVAEGRGAKVAGVDFSLRQVALARARHPRITFELANADSLPFESGSLDAVVNAFGMCHVPDPDAALREAFRVLRPGGRIAFTVWESLAKVVGFGALFAALQAHGTLDVGLPQGPNLFLFADPQESGRALRRAGFVESEHRSVPQLARPASAEEAWHMLTRGSVRSAAMIRGQADDAREAVRRAVIETLQRFRKGERFELPSPAMLSSALRP